MVPPTLNALIRVLICHVGPIRLLLLLLRGEQVEDLPINIPGIGRGTRQQLERVNILAAVGLTRVRLR